LSAQQQGQAVYQAAAGSVPALATQRTPPENESNPFANNNRFLKTYNRQGTAFSALVFEENGGVLSKLNLNEANLKKCVVVFIGDWCPHCEKFIRSLANYIEYLKNNGIKILFIAVPPVNRLLKWKDPTIAGYLETKNKVTSFGVRLSDNVKVVMLGDGRTLARCGVSGLPVLLALDKGKEKFRGTGEGVFSKLNLSDRDVLLEFLEIWKEPETPEEAGDLKEGSAQEVSAQKETKRRKKTEKKSKQIIRTKKDKLAPAKEKISTRRRVNILEARRETDYLNKF
jgi:thiol-disulfide isomerase/thioredoxin